MFTTKYYFVIICIFVFEMYFIFITTHTVCIYTHAEKGYEANLKVGNISEEDCKLK